MIYGYGSNSGLYRHGKNRIPFVNGMHCVASAEIPEISKRRRDDGLSILHAGMV
jgi:hypothetical protein